MRPFQEQRKTLLRFSSGRNELFGAVKAVVFVTQVAALEVSTVKEKGKAEIIFVKYLLIVPYPLRLTFPSCPGANTGATP